MSFDWLTNWLPSRRAQDAFEGVRVLGVPRGKNAGRVLNVVLPKVDFENGTLDDFVTYARALVARFPANEPHAFLFPEHPFGDSYFPSRTDVRSAISQLRDALVRHHPGSVVAFGVNQRSGRQVREGTHVLPSGQREAVVSKGLHVNAGIVVRPDGYSIYPKVSRSNADWMAMVRLGQSLGVDLERDVHALDLTDSRWERRKARTLAKTRPFPQWNGPTGHSIEFRLCEDGGEPGTSAIDVGLVGSHNLLLSTETALMPHANVVFLNDVTATRPAPNPMRRVRGLTDGVGRRVAIREVTSHKASFKTLYNLEKPTGPFGALTPHAQTVNRALAERNVRVHLVG